MIGLAFWFGGIIGRVLWVLDKGQRDSMIVYRVQPVGLELGTIEARPAMGTLRAVSTSSCTWMNYRARFVIG